MILQHIVRRLGQYEFLEVRHRLTHRNGEVASTHINTRILRTNERRGQQLGVILESESLTRIDDVPEVQLDATKGLGKQNLTALVCLL